LKPVLLDTSVLSERARPRAAASLDGRTADPIDALIAASALVRDAVIASRNVRDFEPLGVGVVDPWAA
jgi:predicted nucleic acid-binding protein